MYHVLFDYYEYSDSGEWLGENTDCVEFTHFDEAEEFISQLSDVWNVVLGTDLPVHTCAMPPRTRQMLPIFAA